MPGDRNLPQLKPEVRLLLSDVAQVSALGLLALYALGFVVLNSHLATIGLFSFDFLNAQYLAAGGIATVAFAIFGFMVGRRIFYGPSDFGAFALLGRDSTHPVPWVLFAFLFTLVEIAFGSLVAVVWTSGLLFEPVAEIRAFGGLLVVALFLDFYLLARPGRYQASPRRVLPLVFIAQLLLLVVGAIWIRDSRTLKLLSLYLPAGFVLNFILDSRERYKQGLALTWFWASILLITAASVFGARVYGDVKRGIGGGSAVNVEVVFVTDAPAALRDGLETGGGRARAVSLVAESNQEFVFRKQDRGAEKPSTFRVRKDLVAAVALSQSSYGPGRSLTMAEMKRLLQ